MPFITPPPEGEARGYAAWLMPNDAEEHLFAWLIKRNAERYGGPLFLPHCTLVGGIITFRESVLVKLFRDLARAIRPIVGVLASIETEETFFRALYALFEDPAPIIREQRAIRERIGSMVQPAVPLPHVSILYGAYSAGVKQIVRNSVENMLRWNFRMDTLVVVRTEGTADQWEIIERFSLMKTPNG